MYTKTLVLTAFAIVFIILVATFVVSAGTKIGNAMDPCARAAAQGATLPGCK